MSGTAQWSRGTECVARYNFNGSATHDLPFKKGDILTIVSASRDPNWYKAKRADGLEGMIPANFVFPRVDSDGPPAAEVTVGSKQAVKLREMPWFHGKMTREEAEKKLDVTKDGHFLVRESNNFPGDYTLCVSFEKKVEHYRVLLKSNRVTVDEEEYFENLVKLVEHYQKEADGLCTRLRTPVDKEGKHDVCVDLDAFKKAGWAIPRKDITLGQLLGKGEFGEVFQGEHKKQKVAIKSLKDQTHDLQRFLAEASVMTELRHRNLVSLIGVSLDKSPIYIVTEFMAKGSMVDYLRSRGRAVISKQNQLDFARDVCNGMKYLESRNVVHRDLAARNVLISDDNIAKVSDFGLARETKYVQEGGKFPIKWTSPEALRKSEFSNKSDVWSYGVLLWEIYSYGRVPYPRVPVDQVMQHVEKGYRMDSPDGCPDPVYRIMRDCWEKEPDSRPTFAEIYKTLTTISA